MNSRIRSAWRKWLELQQGIRPGVVAVIIMVIIAALLAVWPRSAKAEDITASNGQDWVRLASEPCSHAGTLIEWLPQLNPQIMRVLRNARAMVGGEDFYGCWAVDGDSAHIFYEDGVSEEKIGRSDRIRTYDPLVPNQRRSPIPTSSYRDFI
jgi:hypothetical protein